MQTVCQGLDLGSKQEQRLGIIGDWENPYLTMDFSAEAVIAEEFMKFMMNGSLCKVQNQ